MVLRHVETCEVLKLAQLFGQQSKLVVIQPKLRQGWQAANVRRLRSEDKHKESERYDMWNVVEKLFRFPFFLFNSLFVIV